MADAITTTLVPRGRLKMRDGEVVAAEPLVVIRVEDDVTGQIATCGMPVDDARKLIDRLGRCVGGC